MKRFGLFLLWVLLLGVCFACTPAPPIIEETIQPEIIELQITPAVEHWLPKVVLCTEDIPNFGLFTRVVPRAELSLEESDLILRLGERLDDDPFVAVMGVEQIVVVAGDNVPVSSLSLDSLQAIYAGQITQWGEVPEANEGVDGKEAPINVVSYPEGHEIEILFKRAYLNDEPIQSNPQVFLTVDFLQKVMESSPYALGFLLESQVPEGMRIISITDEEPIHSNQFVLAITARAPQGRLKELLLCLQNAP